MSPEILICVGGFWAYVPAMDWQQLVALTIVAAAAALLVRGRLRRGRFSFQRDTHCGCTASGSPSSNRIVFRARKGQRPEVVVKMT